VNRLFALLAVIALMLWAPTDARAQEAPFATQAADPAQRQLLVMLRLPPRHYRPDAGYGGNYMHDTGVAARRRVATDIAQAHGLRLRDSWPMPAIGIDCFIMEDTGTLPLARVLDALAQDGRVAWAQALAEYRGLADSDPLYPVQPAAQAWRLADLHRASTAGQVKAWRNFVDSAPDPAEKHGTAVAGIINARTGNGIGIAGMAPRAKVLALRACWESAGQAARCNTLTLGKALNYALENNARIINMSLAGPPDRLLQALLDAAVARGVIVVGAADPHIVDGGFPASHPGVFGVARTGDRHPPSAALLYAPGTDIPSCMPGARWGMVSGSSYAAAHVTGLLALLAEVQPRANAQALRRTLAAQPATIPVNIPGAAPVAGTIDACAALARAVDSCVCLCTSTAVNLTTSLR
jgi:hypothetical protein